MHGLFDWLSIQTAVTCYIHSCFLFFVFVRFHHGFRLVPSNEKRTSFQIGRMHNNLHSKIQIALQLDRLSGGFVSTNLSTTHNRTSRSFLLGSIFGISGAIFIQKNRLAIWLDRLCGGFLSTNLSTTPKSTSSSILLLGSCGWTWEIEVFVYSSASVGIVSAARCQQWCWRKKLWYIGGKYERVVRGSLAKKEGYGGQK